MVQTLFDVNDKSDLQCDPELAALISIFTSMKTCGQNTILKLNSQMQELPLPSRYPRRNRNQAKKHDFLQEENSSSKIND
jgi:hypothetical protein